MCDIKFQKPGQTCKIQIGERNKNMVRYKY
jgi:hypothetical protein